MMKSGKVVYFSLALCLLSSVLVGAEPSAFGAGDLSNPSPYGLTSSEKEILETKKRLKKVAIKSSSQESKLNSLRERIDGMQSIVESLGRETHNNKIVLEKLEAKQENFFLSNNEYQKRLNEAVLNNTQKVEELRAMLKSLSDDVNRFKKSYVSRDEFNILVKEISKQKSVSQNKKVSSAQLYKRAKTNYSKKYYTAAIRDFEELISRNYKPAYSHYMIGEMNFKRKNYAKAIAYFKKSVKLYSKASYMPNLMLHTAISMYRTGDKQHAQDFFGAIIVKYPSSKEVKEAKKYLGNI